MKKNYLLMIALITVTFFGAGCSKEEEGSNELKVTTNVTKSLTKSMVSEFSGSTIGVFVAGISENSTAIVSTGANAVAVTPSIPITADATVYAWYPATGGEITNPTSTSTKDITVVNADDFAATDQTDYLYATPATVTTTNRTAELTFKHALSKVIFKVKKVDDFSGTGDLSAIALSSTETPFLSGSGTMTIADGSISGLTATDNLTYTGSYTLTTTAQEAVALVAPTTLAANTSATSTITITLTIDDDDSYSTTLPVLETSEWAAGNTYTYNITVKNGELEIGNVSITPWGVNNETSLDVEPVTLIDD